MECRIDEMDIRRFYTNSKPRDGGFLLSEDYNHIVRVLRYRKGYKLIVCNGDGNDYHCEIADIGEDCVAVKIEKTERNGALPVIHINFCPAILKRDKFEFVIQKAVELGVSEITPILTERCCEKSVNTDRAEKIIVDAAKQCGLAVLPVLNPTVSFAEFCDGKHDGAVFAAYESERKRGVGDVDFASDKINLVIGPEGGFSEAEARRLEETATTFSLGRRILRAETAAIAALTLVNFSAGGMKP